MSNEKSDRVAKYTLWNSPPSEWEPPLGQPGMVVKLDIEGMIEEERMRLESCEHSNAEEKWVILETTGVDGNTVHSRVRGRFMYCPDCVFNYEEVYEPPGLERRRTPFYDPKVKTLSYDEKTRRWKSIDRVATS